MDAGHIQTKIANALGQKWSRDRVADHVSLRKLSPETWALIVASVEGQHGSDNGDSATEDVANATRSLFNEGLLRPILDLLPEQQLELCTNLAQQGSPYKNTFKKLALAYKARNASPAVCVIRVGHLMDS